MWWYRNRDAGGAAKTVGDTRRPRPAADPLSRLVAALGRGLTGRTRDPDGLLAMSLLVDSRITLTDGTVFDGLSWQEAEEAVQSALPGAGPLRLYNRFAREIRDGYTCRPELPEEHRAVLGALREALCSSEHVASVEPR